MDTIRGFMRRNFGLTWFWALYEFASIQAVVTNVCEFFGGCFRRVFCPSRRRLSGPFAAKSIWSWIWRLLFKFCTWPLDFCRWIWSFQWPTWEPNPDGLLVQVVNTSRLDGFRSALRPKIHFVLRLLYVISYTACAAFGILMIITTIVKLMDTQMIYQLAGRVVIENIPFAGVTVCPSHLISRSTMDEAVKIIMIAFKQGYATDMYGKRWSLSQATKLYFYVTQRCNAAKSFSRRFGQPKMQGKLDLKTYEEYIKQIEKTTFVDDPEDPDYKEMILPFLKKGMMTCKDMLAVCRWGNNEKCEDIFEVVETGNGDCCSFNVIPSRILKREQKKKLTNLTNEETAWKAWNIDNHQFLGKKLQEFINRNDIPRKQKHVGSEFGLSFVLRFPEEPRKEWACPVNEANGYSIIIQPSLELPQPKSNAIVIGRNTETFINIKAGVIIASDSVKTLTLASRKCYLQSENFLTQYTRYTESNCKSECLSKLIYERCQCNKLYTTAGQREIICGPLQVDCQRAVESDLIERGYEYMCATLFKPINCLPSCTEVTYGVEVSSADFSSFAEPGQVNITEGEIISVVHISFGSDNVFAQKRDQQYDILEIIGIVGGLTGLTNGLDMMSFVHLFVALIVLIWGLFGQQEAPEIAAAIALAVLALNAQRARLMLPAPMERLALPAPPIELRTPAQLMLPAPVERLALPAPPIEPSPASSSLSTNNTIRDTFVTVPIRSREMVIIDMEQFVEEENPQVAFDNEQDLELETIFIIPRRVPLTSVIPAWEQ